MSVHAYPAAFTIYVAVAYGIALLSNRPLPHAVEVLVTVLVWVPLFLIFAPLFPLLRRLGLLEGQMFRFPSLLGVIIGTVIYVALFYVVAAFRKGRSR